MIAWWMLGCVNDPVEGDATATTGDTAGLEAPPPNVLVVLLDDVGLDGIAAFGVSPDPPPTPTMDRIVDEGVRFTRAYSYPVCGPSRAALLTGRYGRRNGFGNNIPGARTFALPPEEVTFAHVARESGYATGAFGKWHLAGRQPDVAFDPLDKGFDHFDGMLGNFGAYVGDFEGPWGYTRWEHVVDGEVALSLDYAPTVVIDSALTWIDAQPGPWLAYVAMPTAHGPMHVPPDDLHSTGVTADSTPPELFRAVVEAGDREIGRLLDGIDPAVLENTVVVLTSDNGTDAGRDAPGFEVLGGKVSVYEGGIRVPLVVWGPVVSRPGEAHDGLVHLVDIVPTIADLVSAEPTTRYDGRSLLPLVREPARPNGRDLMYAEYFGPVGPGPYVIDWRLAIGPEVKLIDALHFDETRVTTLGPNPADEVQYTVDDAPTESSRLAELRAFLETTERQLASGD